MTQNMQWYKRKSTLVVAICVFILFYTVWFWRDWSGIGIETQFRTNITNSFQYALKQSAYEAPITSLVHITTDKEQTFYVPDYSQDDSAGIYNAMNLKGIFIAHLNNSPSMPLFRVKSIQIEPTDTMQYMVQVRYSTWLGLSKTVTVSGNPPIPHKKK